MLTPSQDDGSGFVYCTSRSQRTHSPKRQDPRSTQGDPQSTQNPRLETATGFTNLRDGLKEKDNIKALKPNTCGLEAQHDADQTRDYNTVTTVSPPREIPLLPPMDQYLFQFYLAETMRLTVPSSYARTEICRFLVPMSIQQPSLLYAVMAFAAVHLSAIGKLPNNSEYLINILQCTSIQHLRHLLADQNPVAKAVALATARTLCQAQIYGGTSSWRVHLNGARAILQSSHFKNQLTNGCACSSTDAAFLSSWFNNAEGLAALSPTGLVNGQLEGICRTSPSVYFDMFGGVMSDLPDLFREVGALVKEARRRKRHDTSQPSILSETDIRLEAERLTREILSKLERDGVENLALRPDLLLTLSMNDICDYALSNAGFLYNALLHIYCGVRDLSPSAAEVEFCVSQIIRCAEDMTYSAGLSPRVLLVAPLFTAGICATSAAQSSIRSALEDIGKWMRTPHLKKTLAFLERIWPQSADDCVWSEFGKPQMNQVLAKANLL
ncbi:cytochrome P450 4ac1 [Fusarium albosuccineum]|uniref:Cytochrome P450 4ac1 n=1 Tax=Fusarium albosuccineum TaxID=1237068 RepID=A0A8H4LAZ0_9HYPO|nr:cytochrome P450 4ac1 [Fusarium albosuccineum]